MNGKRILLLLGLAIGLFTAGAAGLVAIAGFLSYEKIDFLDNPVVALLKGDSALTAPTSHPAAGLSSLTDLGDYKTENNWIATRNAEEIARMSWLAIHPQKPMPSLKVRATVDPQRGFVHLELSGWSDSHVDADITAAYAWDPKAYATFAHQLLGDLKPTEPATPVSPDFLNDLLTPTGQVLGTKDIELSQALSQNPASVALHEDAALLLLTIALRENAFTLSDIRTELCRSCAHLAVAEALAGRGPDTLIGKVAGAALVSLAGREVEANAQLDMLSNDGGSNSARQELAAKH